MKLMIWIVVLLGFVRTVPAVCAERGDMLISGNFLDWQKSPHKEMHLFLAASRFVTDKWDLSMGVGYDQPLGEHSRRTLGVSARYLLPLTDTISAGPFAAVNWSEMGGDTRIYPYLGASALWMVRPAWGIRASIYRELTTQWDGCKFEFVVKP